MFWKCRHKTGANNCKKLTIAALIVLWFPAHSALGNINKQLRVTIISVIDFNDPELKNPILTKAIQDTTSQLEKFFITQFGVEPRIMSTRSETTAEELRKWLFHDLSSDSSQSIQLIFVLTHGIGYQYSGSTAFKNELFLASSDTKSNDYFGVAIRGSELIDAFQRLSRGSSVFLFLDTCGSGAIDNSGISRLLEEDRFAGTRMMILAGSFSDENSFRARFTQTLLDIWNAQPASTECHSGENGIEDFVRQRMNQLAPLDPKFTQNVNVVFSYTTDFCIESFASGGALALLGNPTDVEVSVVLHQANSMMEPILFRIKAKDVHPVVLHRAVYDAVVTPITLSTPSSVTPANISIDLTSEFVQYQSLYQSETLNLAVNQQKAVQIAQAFGAPTEAVFKLNDSARAQFGVAIETVKAKKEQLEQTVNTQKLALANAENQAVAQSQKVVDATATHVAVENRIRTTHHMVGIVDVSPSNTPLSTAEANQWTVTSDAVDRARQASEDASREVDAERRRLSEAEANGETIAAEVVEVQKTLDGLDNLVKRQQARQSARAKLLRLLNQTFPTEDTPRGLATVIPKGASQSQLFRFGKAVSSFEQPLLTEIEVEVTGHNRVQNRHHATKLASSLRGKLLRGTGLSGDLVVARGFGGIGDRPQMTQRIIISGDPIDGQ